MDCPALHIRGHNSIFSLYEVDDNVSRCTVLGEGGREREREKLGHRQTDRHTERESTQTEREKGTDKDRDRERQSFGQS